MSKITANTPAPRYLAVALAIQHEITGLSPNALLPTEEQFANRYSVSRVTVRSALDLLEKNGQISRLRGRGTTVSPKKITRNFAPLFSFEQDLTNQGIKFETRVLSYEPRSTPSESIRSRLILPPGSTVGCLSIVRIVYDRVICYERRHYPPEIAAKLEPDRVEHHDASETLEDLIGAQIAEVDWESEISSAPGDAASALEISPRTLVLANSYTWRLAKSLPVEAGTIFYRIDRCKFRYELRFSHARPREARGANMA
jgi:GntR family transcriptional regulator